jgi:hypothetical protein
MRYLRVSMLAGVLVTGAAFAKDPGSDAVTEMANAPDANLQLSESTFALGIGYTRGRGEITYQGTRHTFRVSGISIVDVGAANSSAVGSVYHLHKLEDLNGNYVAASAGLTIAGGGDAVVLRNEHGVFIKLLATNQGLRFNLAGAGMSVKLES